MDETTSTTAHRHSTASSMSLRYDTTLPGVSLYNLFVDDEDKNKLPHLVAVVAVDLETRAIRVSKPTDLTEIATNGLASWTFDEKDGEGRKRISGRSVANYVLPRSARFLARLYVVNA